MREDPRDLDSGAMAEKCCRGKVKAWLGLRLAFGVSRHAREVPTNSGRARTIFRIPLWVGRASP